MNTKSYTTRTLAHVSSTTTLLDKFTTQPSLASKAHKLENRFQRVMQMSPANAATEVNALKNFMVNLHEAGLLEEDQWFDYLDALDARF